MARNIEELPLEILTRILRRVDWKTRMDSARFVNDRWRMCVDQEVNFKELRLTINDDRMVRLLYGFAPWRKLEWVKLSFNTDVGLRRYELIRFTKACPSLARIKIAVNLSGFSRAEATARIERVGQSVFDEWMRTIPMEREITIEFKLSISFPGMDCDTMGLVANSSGFLRKALGDLKWRKGKKTESGRRWVELTIGGIKIVWGFKQIHEMKG